MSERAELRVSDAAAAPQAAPRATQPPAGYAGAPRSPQLEYEAVLANASIGIAFTRERRFALCNSRFEELLGWGPGELVGQPGEVIFTSPESYEAMAGIATPMLAAGRQLDLEWELRRKDGSHSLYRMIAKAINAANTQQGTIWIVEDISERKRADDEIRRLAAEQELIFANATVGISYVRERVFQRCNPRLEEMFGYAAGELVGCGTRLLYPSEADFEEALAGIRARLAAGEPYTDERWMQRKDGNQLWCRIIGRAIDPAAPQQGAIWIFDDISAEHAARESLEASRAALERAVGERTAELKAANRRLREEIAERKQAEGRARHLADHDALTGLPNRRLLEDRLTQALGLGRRNRKQTAVMFVDLDRFKSINDSLGHAAGDALLREVAQRLVGELRGVDTICRIGGDEFVVVLPEVRRPGDAANVAHKLIESLSQPVVLDGRELSVTPSVGIAVFPEDGQDAESLIRNADAAMYYAKQAGRARYQFFTEQMNQAASNRLALESELRVALPGGELRLHYQPIVARDGSMAEYEALLRWQHPRRGLLLPAQFLRIADESGLTLQLGQWVLNEACRWAAAHGRSVAVNLSARQFNDPELPALVAQALRASGLASDRLGLEIAESTVMPYSEATVRMLARLKALGVSLAVDDFGTGYSSLAQLKRLPFDRLKIDRSLIAVVAEDHGGEAVVAAIVEAAHALGLQVTAVGVETPAQMERLQASGCDLVQGRLSGVPVDADGAPQGLG